MDLELLLAREDAGDPVLKRGLEHRSVLKEPPPPRTEPVYLFDLMGGPDSLPEQRWGIVAPEGPRGDRLVELIRPLREAREAAQGGGRAREYRVPPGMDALAALKWKAHIYQDEAVPEEQVPRYLLFLGDFHEVSLELQQVLAPGAFVGRLCFPTDEGYEAYVHKVLRWERQAATKERRRLLFFTAHDGSGATRMGFDGLMRPARLICEERRARGAFPADEVLEVGSPEDWSGEQLLAAAHSGPGVLFTMSHGLGVPHGDPGSYARQRERQGALCLQSRDVLAASDLASRPFLPGGLWFFFACFSAGTPSRSAYHAWLSRLREDGEYFHRVDPVLAHLPREGEAPFVAALPQAVLANPEGPLAVIGHADLAWTYSFRDEERSYTSRFVSLLKALVMGRSAGLGLTGLTRFVDAVQTELAILYSAEENAKYGHAPPLQERIHRAHLWMARHDLAGYILLGDPAVRLPTGAVAS
jgi:hypothetical protein